MWASLFKSSINFHPLTSPFKVVSVTAVATMLPGHHAYERATETFETTTTATVHWKTEGWWSNGDGWKELKGNWVMESANMLKILRASSAWISIWWLDCPLKFDSMAGLLQEVDVPSCTPRMHKKDLIQSESGLSCTIPSPSNPALFCNGMFPYHAVFGPSQDEWFKGSQANVLVETSARSEHQNLRTAETWIDVGWCRGRRLSGAVDPKVGGNSNGNSVTVYVL